MEWSGWRSATGKCCSTLDVGQASAGFSPAPAAQRGSPCRTNRSASPGYPLVRHSQIPRAVVKSRSPPQRPFGGRRDISGPVARPGWQRVRRDRRDAGGLSLRGRAPGRHRHRHRRILPFGGESSDHRRPRITLPEGNRTPPPGRLAGAGERRRAPHRRRIGHRVRGVNRGFAMDWGVPLRSDRAYT